MINPQWLMSFQAIVEQGNFTRAAEHLNLTQAAVSQHLRYLEDEFGLLILRKTRPLELTPIGREVLSYAQEIKDADERLRLRLSSTDSLVGEVGLITPGSSGLLLYPRLLALQHQYDGLVIRHRFAPDTEVLQAILTNQYDIGLITFDPQDAKIRAEPIAKEPLELVYPRNENVETWDDLIRIGIIDYPDGRAMADRLLSRHFPGNPGVKTLPRSGFSNQISLILEPVALGLGFTVLPRYARQAFAKQDEIAFKHCENPVVNTLWAIYRADWPLSRRVLNVLNCVKTTLSS
ncbi:MULTISPECIES: LysR family transcriptional regulator [Nitrincola]|uniref:CysJI operon transcriptional activator n=1 Tax=Nitrincola nitratireducens TaxID=1229521 RepID=W9V8P0_9GAMM|nr:MULTISPECIES: LysR family transcriptional regulator [Nitrincola]EXJ12417.1 CysJI operon transcriptional activator [Nitrincola nitratireducens]